jgi:DHA2 family multidrug resistance protein-like MFS transporter
MFGLVIFGSETLARQGSKTGILLLLGGVLLGAGLVRREWNRPAPLVPVDLLRIPIFGLSAATSIVSFAAQMLALISVPFCCRLRWTGRSWSRGC